VRVPDWILLVRSQRLLHRLAAAVLKWCPRRSNRCRTPLKHSGPRARRLVVLDHGQGPVRLALFTMIEVVDDTGVPTHFGSDNGSIHEGAGTGVSFARGTEDRI